jgi:hypothetical protein
VQRAPGIPHALFGRKISCTNSGALRGEDVEVCFNVMSTQTQLVMPGPDPGIHLYSQEHF